jgi:hypothetical protein
MTPVKPMKISDIPPKIEPTSFRIADELVHPTPEPAAAAAEVSRWSRLQAWLGAQATALFDGCAKSSLADSELAPPLPRSVQEDSVVAKPKTQVDDPTWDILRTEVTLLLRRQAANRRL